MYFDFFLIFFFFICMRPKSLIMLSKSSWPSGAFAAVVPDSQDNELILWYCFVFISGWVISPVFVCLDQSLTLHRARGIVAYGFDFSVKRKRKPIQNNSNNLSKCLYHSGATQWLPELKLFCILAGSYWHYSLGWNLHWLSEEMAVWLTHPTPKCLFSWISFCIILKSTPDNTCFAADKEFKKEQLCWLICLKSSTVDKH